MKASILVLILSAIPVMRNALLTNEMLGLFEMSCLFFGFLLSVSIFENREKILEIVERMLDR